MARLLTFEERAKAAEEYWEHRRKAEPPPPPPRVRNLDAVLTFERPREFQWGGVGYRAPPLSYRLGMQLTVAASALADLRLGRVAATQGPAIEATARALLRRAVRPRRRSHFREDDALALERLCLWMVAVPDDTPSPEPERQLTLDFSDTLALFIQHYPGWLVPRRPLDALLGRRSPDEGLPRSWQAYILGIRHLGREAHRQDLRNATAARFAQADQKAFTLFERRAEAAAGWG